MMSRRRGNVARHGRYCLHAGRAFCQYTGNGPHPSPIFPLQKASAGVLAPCCNGPTPKLSEPEQNRARSNRTIFFPDGKPDPILPSDRAHVTCAKHVERGSIAVCHHAKGLRGRLHIDCLPISVQNENHCFIQDVAHSVFRLCVLAKNR